MNWYLKVLRNYATFNGRARRKEYWMFAVFNLLFGVSAVIIDNVLGLNGLGGYGPFYLIYNLAMLIPSIAVGVRRLHDVNKSGWMFLIFLIPIVGAIWLFILMVKEGDKEENKYGLSPKT